MQGTVSEPPEFSICSDVELMTRTLTLQQYLDFDGKKLGRRNVSCSIVHFQGARRIDSLNVVPLKYRSNADQIRLDLIERGKKFVSLCNVLHRGYRGPAFWGTTGPTIRRYVEGRVMIDAAKHPYNSPGSVVSSALLRDSDCDTSSDDSDDDGHYSESEACVGWETDTLEDLAPLDGSVYDDEHGHAVILATNKSLTEDEYLVAAPVVLAFILQENIWAEILVSRVDDVKWNDKAYSSLVLDSNAKLAMKVRSRHSILQVHNHIQLTVSTTQPRLWQMHSRTTRQIALMMSSQATVEALWLCFMGLPGPARLCPLLPWARF